MNTTTRRPLFFTFGNHMHWVDMQWLWGYHVLPGSVRDMLHLVKETGARGNVNFDAVGYEKMAAESPDALDELRAGVKKGDIEPVGCSYGQPYGLFQGGESNIRQLTYGVRSTQRLLGVRPRAFWEEEFYFFPQLPQLLTQCGYTGACLFFQWTWHTPELPKETAPIILWEGIDGSRLPALPRNDLNLHQWPEDFDGVLDRVASMPADAAAPAIVQWLELMPSKDWMCRSEVLLPRLRELMTDGRFDVRPGTVSDLIRALTSPTRQRGLSTPQIPVRAYTMDDVWHGMTLGKNADEHPRASRNAERSILIAEAASATASLFGRPYASWDVYPTWELDEAWRECLAAQHHDNHECEGLCGFVGHRQFRNAEVGAEEVLGRAAWLLARRAGLPSNAGLVINPHGWAAPIDGYVHNDARHSGPKKAPPFGYSTLPRAHAKPSRVRFARTKDSVTLSRGRASCTVSTRTGCITALAAGARRIEGDGIRLLDLSFYKNSKRFHATPRQVRVEADQASDVLRVTRSFPGGIVLSTFISIPASADAIHAVVHFEGRDEPGDTLRPDPGLNNALQATFHMGDAAFETIADNPLSVSSVCGGGDVRRKYPTADWMTSPQWFESVKDPFTAATFVDLVDPRTGDGLLVCHDGAQQWFRNEHGVRVVLTAYDPWDEGRYSASGGWSSGTRFRLAPHGTITNAQRITAAQEAHELSQDLFGLEAQPVGGGTAYGVEQDIPPVFGPLEVCDAPNVLAHAFFRESMKSGEHLPDWAGHRMFEESEGACDHPFVVRLVEWNGEPARVRLKLAGKVAMAAKTNLMGEVGTKGNGTLAGTSWLKVRHPVDPPAWGKEGGKSLKFRGKAITWSEVEFEMRPREVATVYADMVMGRKEFRDLDAKRKVWATTHKSKKK
jgi:alpha-mannosidase